VTPRRIVFLCFGHVLKNSVGMSTFQSHNLPSIKNQKQKILCKFCEKIKMLTVCHETFQNVIFSVRIEAKNDPLNIPIFGFELIFLKEVRYRFYNGLLKDILLQNLISLLGSYG